MNLFGGRRSRTDGASDAAAEMALLGKHAGVGLWDAVLVDGDPMHARSQWRWSDEFRRLIGFDHGDRTGFPDVVGSWADRLHPEDAPPTFNAFMACLNDRSGRTGYDVQYRLKMKAGNYRWFRAIGGVARDPGGKAERACGALIDIDAEHNTAERTSLLDRFAGVGLWDAQIHNGDPMHRQSQWQWSGEFRRLVGFDRDDDAGFPNLVGSWADRLHPDDARRTFDAFMGCLNDRSGRTGYDVEYRLRLKDGSYRWFRAVGGISRDAQGIAQRACGSLIDIHDTKTAEVMQAEGEANRRRTIERLADDLDANVAKSVDTATANAQTVAAAAEELSTSIADISRRAGTAAESASRASGEADRTNTAVQALVTAADRIGVVVKLINDIASQTNLLALNATIEAARAGEAGRGFAVVAGEVKSLAQQTGRATEEIGGQIGAVQQEARKAVEAIGSIAAIIAEVQQISTNIASAVAQQDSATREISSSVGLVVDNIEDVSSRIRTVTENLKGGQLAR